MKLASVVAVIGTLIGGIVLSMLIVRFYPSDNILNRLYGAVFLAVFATMVMFIYSLTAQSWRQTLLRSCSWWPIPMILLLGGWL